jgi:hypothetical protein
MLCVIVLKAVGSAGLRMGLPSGVTCAGVEDAGGIEDVVVVIVDPAGRTVVVPAITVTVVLGREYQVAASDIQSEATRH